MLMGPRLLYAVESATDVADRRLRRAFRSNAVDATDRGALRRAGEGREIALLYYERRLSFERSSRLVRGHLR